jgi:hypothetical protein
MTAPTKSGGQLFIVDKSDESWKGLKYWSYGKRFIEHLPIRPVDFSSALERVEHDALVALVDRIVKTKRTDGAADRAALERELDERVYGLCGLTAEEIRMVEEASE